MHGDALAAVGTEEREFPLLASRWTGRDPGNRALTKGTPIA